MRIYLSVYSYHAVSVCPTQTDATACHHASWDGLFAQTSSFIWYTHNFALKKMIFLPFMQFLSRNSLIRFFHYSLVIALWSYNIGRFQLHHLIIQFSCSIWIHMMTDDIKSCPSTNFDKIHFYKNSLLVCSKISPHPKKLDH